jgi:hypothetical protein
MSYPYWATPSNLGSFEEGYSFVSNPLELVFGETDNLACSVLLLNGGLPPGVRWQQNGFSVFLLGQVTGIISDTNFEFTFRINNGTYSTDQTFFITITNTVDVLQWVTDYNQPLGYYYASGVSNFSVLAKNNPEKSINYSINTNGLSNGFAIENSSGLISVDLSWIPNYIYKTTDYVLNNTNLYKCSVSGQSGFSIGPVTTGTGIVDSNYSAWTPNTYYIYNSVVTNDTGKIYLCIAAGLSSPSVGPTGTGASISEGGVILWKYIGQSAVWDQVGVDTAVTVFLPVTATTNTQSITENFAIGLISRPFQPIWITPAGSLDDSVLQNEFFAYQLAIVEPDFLAPVFTSDDLPSWLNLSKDGELWGTAPTIKKSTVYDFTVTVTAGSTTNTQNFSVQVINNIAQLSWLTPSDLGSIIDGSYSNLQVVATSATNKFVSYSLTGGTLPPNTTLLYDSGILSGFVEFHGQNKTYYFEITATDGINNATQIFNLTVISENIGPYMNLSIPIMGTDKTLFNTNNSNDIIDQKYLYKSIDPNWGRNTTPEVQIINGFNVSNPSDLRNAISSWLHEFTVNYTTINTSNDPSLLYQTLFVRIRDSESVLQWQPFTSYNKGQIVNNGDGNCYIAVYSGTSGDYPGPTATQSTVNDGTVVWEFNTTPNTVVNSPQVFPWYPQHFYKVGQTVVNNGDLYRCLYNGYSGGDFGPTGKNSSITDGEIAWQWIETSTSTANLYYPSSIFNIRNAIKTISGFANSQGVGATANAVVDSTTTGIVSVQITTGGHGYFRQPKINTIGTGAGAILSANLILNSGTITQSTVGFAVGQTFTVNQGIGTAGEISITGVDLYGRVTFVEILNQGNYSIFPQTAVVFTNNFYNFSVQFDLGIGSVDVISTGSGYEYANTFLDFSGEELLSNWEKGLGNGYIAHVPLAEITVDGPSAYASNQFNQNPYDGEKIEVKYLKLIQQGVKWTGNTTFDQISGFDGGQTRFVETDTASQTIFDMNQTYFENKNTIFDETNTAINNNTFETDFILDFNDTSFDKPLPPTNSQYSITWWIALGKPFC